MGRTILVAGLGRCGTTMVMRMLDAADVPTVGDAPDWECVEAQMLLEDDPVRWAERARGKAVKLLDAHRFAVPDIGEYDLLWLERDSKEQARSMLKLVASVFSTVTVDRQSIRAMATSIRRDTPAALHAIERIRKPRRGISLRFEDILSRPAASAQVICQAFDIAPANVDAMAAQVIHRGPKCLPYLMEASLV